MTGRWGARYYHKRSVAERGESDSESHWKQSELRATPEVFAAKRAEFLKPDPELGHWWEHEGLEFDPRYDPDAMLEAARAVAAEEAAAAEAARGGDGFASYTHRHPDSTTPPRAGRCRGRRLPWLGDPHA